MRPLTRAIAGALCACASALPACAPNVATARIEPPARGNVEARPAPSMSKTTAGNGPTTTNTARTSQGCVIQYETITNIPAVRVFETGAQQSFLWRQAESAPAPLPIVAPNL